MTYFNYKGILQESLTLKISVQKYSERFANRNYTAELQQEFANQISDTNNLSIQYQDAIDRKEVATAELRDFIKETQNDLKIVRTAGKNVFARGSVELRNLGVGEKPAAAIDSICGQTERVLNNVILHKDRLIAEGGLIESEYETIAARPAELRDKDARQNALKAEAVAMGEKLQAAARKLNAENAKIYRIASLEFADEPDVLREIIKAKESR